MCGQSSSSSSPSTSIWTGWSAVVTQLSVNFGLCGLLQILPRWRFCLKNCKSHYSKYHNSDFPLKRSQYRRWVLTATANWWWKRVASFSSRILSTRTGDLTLRSKNSWMNKEIEMARVFSNAHESFLQERSGNWTQSGASNEPCTKSQVNPFYQFKLAFHAFSI